MRIADRLSALLVAAAASACSGTVSVGALITETTAAGGTTGAGGAGGAVADASGGAAGAAQDASAGASGGDADASSDASWTYPATVPVGAPVPIGDQNGVRKIVIENHCTYTVWAAAIPSSTFPGSVPLGIASGQAFQLTWPQTGWSGRIWGRTQCTPAANGAIPTGNCVADTFVANSLVELTLGDPDFYDVSLVDGFNIPIGIIVMGHDLDQNDVSNCGSPVCAKDLLFDCPASQQYKDNNGDVVACKNKQNLGDITRWFKARCPTSATYPSYDTSSAFTCRGYPSYTISFCPTEGARGGFP
jgi:Thaumatin family